MGLVISTRVRDKLARKNPPVTRAEIVQCFANRSGTYLFDPREQHKSTPPTQWFIAETDFGRKLKVVFIPKGNNICIRTAYQANDEEIRIYNKYSSRTTSD